MLYFSSVPVRKIAILKELQPRFSLPFWGTGEHAQHGTIVFQPQPHPSRPFVPPFITTALTLQLNFKLKELTAKKLQISIGAVIGDGLITTYGKYKRSSLDKLMASLDNPGNDAIHNNPVGNPILICPFHDGVESVLVAFCPGTQLLARPIRLRKDAARGL